MITTRALAAIEGAGPCCGDQFGIGRDDGLFEHEVQIWATEKPDERMRWIEERPPGEPRTAQLRARIEHVLSR